MLESESSTQSVVSMGSNAVCGWIGGVQAGIRPGALSWEHRTDGANPARPPDFHALHDLLYNPRGDSSSRVGLSHNAVCAVQP
jgi:hypothetical protein